MNDRLTMLNSLRDQLNQRATYQGWRKRDGSLTKAGNAAALEFIIGAAAAAHALGLDSSHNLTGLAFAASVRGADDFLKG